MKTWRVNLVTTEPDAADLVGFMRERGVTRAAIPGCATGFEEFVYRHADRATLVEMIREFWGDNGDDEYIEPEAV